MTHRPLCNIYAASCAPDGGIFRYQLFWDGTLKEVDHIPLDRPMYFVKRGEMFHTLLREPEGLGGESGYVACRFGEPVPAPISTGGEVACHLCEMNGRIYAVNYISGSISEIGGKTVVHQRELLENTPNPEQTVRFSAAWQKQRLALQANRQDAPHTHQIIPSPDGQFLLVADLGLDAVFVYDPELNLCFVQKMPERSGVRHMIFGKEQNGSYPLYCACELDSTVCTLSYREGKLTFLGATDSHIVRPDNAAAAIRLSPDGKTLYVSQRGENCISVYRIGEDGIPKWLSNAPCGGDFPRDFCLTPDGDFLICANERSSTLSVLAMENGTPRVCSETPLADSLCVFAEKVP